MRRGTLLLIISAAAASIAGCGGTLVSPERNDAASALPDAPPAVSDTAPTLPDGITILDAGRVDASVGIDLCFFNEIAESVAGTSCQFLIPNAAVCRSFGARMFVIIGGAHVPEDPSNGWTYTDDTEATIELHGAACDLANQSATGVMIEFQILVL